MLVLVVVHAYGRWSSEWRSLDFILVALALNRRGWVVISKLFIWSPFLNFKYRSASRRRSCCNFPGCMHELPAWIVLGRWGSRDVIWSVPIWINIKLVSDLTKIYWFAIIRESRDVIVSRHLLLTIFIWRNKMSVTIRELYTNNYFVCKHKLFEFIF
jgi:hypothetical protein